MRGVYVVTGVVTGVTVAEPLLYLQAPSDHGFEVTSAIVTTASVDADDRMEIAIGISTGTPSGGTSVTPRPTDSDSGASGVTAAHGDTAITGLTLQTPEFDRVGVSVLGGWSYQPIPEERCKATASEIITINSLRTVTSVAIIVRVTFLEL